MSRAEVYETDAGDYVVAWWDDRASQYQASVSPAYRQQTGLSAAFARSIDTLATLGGVTRYRSLSAARRALARQEGDE